jgi:hemoglobin-like flavoprotein
MDPREISLVRRSLATCNPSSLAFAAELFHRRLFHLAPELEAHFDPDEQTRDAAFLEFLWSIVGELDRLDDALPRLLELSRTAREAGATADDYEAVRAALLFALRTALFESFSAQVRAAWSSTFDHVSGVVLHTLRDAPARRDGATQAGRTAASSGTHRISALRDNAEGESAPSSRRAAG